MKTKDGLKGCHIKSINIPDEETFDKLVLRCRNIDFGRINSGYNYELLKRQEGRKMNTCFFFDDKGTYGLSNHDWGNPREITVEDVIGKTDDYKYKVGDRVIATGDLYGYKKKPGTIVSEWASDMDPWKVKFDHTKVILCSSINSLLKVTDSATGSYVHCKTQEEWDFACEKCDKSAGVSPEFKTKGFDTFDYIGTGSCEFGGWQTLEYFQENHSDARCLSFQEWCDLKGYTFNSGFKVNDWVVVDKSVLERYDEYDYIGKAVKIIEPNSTPSNCMNVDIPHNSGGGLNVNKADFRPATQEEIDKVSKPKSDCWYIKIDDENRHALDKWRTAGSIMDTTGYLLSQNHPKGNGDIGYWVSTRPSEGEEIIFDEFLDKYPDFKPEPKSLTADDLVEGEVYHFINKSSGSRFTLKYTKSGSGCFNIQDERGFYKNGGFSTSRNYNKNSATPHQKKWLNTCIKQDKFIDESELGRYDDKGRLIVLPVNKFNKWYTYTGHSKVLVYALSDNSDNYDDDEVDITGYGINYKGEWVKMGSSWTDWRGYELASKETVNKMLLKYAKENYPKGTKYNSALDNQPGGLVREVKWSDNDILSGGKFIYYGDEHRWAKLTKKEDTMKYAVGITDSLNGIVVGSKGDILKKVSGGWQFIDRRISKRMSWSCYSKTHFKHFDNIRDAEEFSASIKGGQLAGGGDILVVTGNSSSSCNRVGSIGVCTFGQKSKDSSVNIKTRVPFNDNGNSTLPEEFRVASTSEITAYNNGCNHIDHLDDYLASESLLPKAASQDIVKVKAREEEELIYL